MIRLPLVIAGGLVAAAAAVTPAVVGLTANPSFSQQVPVRVPAHASLATFPRASSDERSAERHEVGPRHRDDAHRSLSEPVETPLASPRHSEPEPGRDRKAGDDRGRRRGPESGDDRGRGREPETGEHRGSGRAHSRAGIDGSALSDRSAVESGNDGAAVVGGRRGGDDDGRR